MDNSLVYNGFTKDEVEVWNLVNEAVPIINAAVDITVESTNILSMTPKEGYQKKVDLIYSAEDMSTKEKIQALNQAEDKYAQDLGRTADLCKGLMWTKAGVVIIGIAGVLFIGGTSEGRMFIDNIFKRSSTVRKECV